MLSDNPTPQEALDHYRKAFVAVRGKPASFQSVGSALYWLEGSPLTLYCLDTASPTPTPVKVLDAVERKGTMSREEELARERQRATLGGISAFRVVRGGGRVFFASNGTWYVFARSAHSDGGGITTPLFENLEPPLPSAAAGGGVISDVQFAPDADNADTVRVSFVFANNLFVATLHESGNPESAQSFRVTARVQQLTDFGTELAPVAVADYIIQEEFSRFVAHWWSPDSARILFTHSDTSTMPKVTIMDSATTTYEMPFPKVGEPNPVVTVAVVDVASGALSYLPQLDAPGFVDHGVEYVPRLGWAGGAAVHLLALSRSQEDATFLVVPLSAFVPAGSGAVIDAFTHRRVGADAGHAAVTPAQMERRVVKRVSIPWAWVEVTDALFYDPDGRALIGLHDAADETAGGAYFHLFREPLGDESAAWEDVTPSVANVVASTVRVVGSRRDVAFAANSAASRLGRTLYLRTPSGTATISPPGAFVHAFHIICGAEGGLPSAAFLLTSDMKSPPAASLVPLDPVTGAPDTTQSAKSVPFVSQFTRADIEGMSMKLADRCITCRDATTGAPIADAAVFVPATSVVERARLNGGLPLVVYVYGGPHVQLVAESFDINSNHFFSSLVACGFAVAVVDNRMSNANGLRTHAAVKRNFGRFETADHLAAVDVVVAELGAGTINPQRVAIMGWSYGGYATLLAMAQAADRFKLGFAGAPVGSFTLYDTGYTERYGGLLPEARAAYDQGTIAAFADGFPDEPNRVFIAHGLSDENVHFAHTCAIVEAMIARQKPFAMQVYPGERHGLRQRPESRPHYDLQTLRTMLQLL